MPSTPIDARRITVHHGPRTVLRDVDLRVHHHSRIGLIGPNGSGKSTLLRVLAGVARPDSGTVRRAGTIGHLPQVTGETDDTPARDVALARAGVAAAVRDLDAHAARLAAGDLDAVGPHAAALDRWLALGGDDADARLAIAADELGLPAALLDRPIGALSGGQAAKVGLVALRISRHDVVLLDEPTNHLDADGLAALDRFLREHRGGAVIVSHDRALMEEAVGEVVVLDAQSGRAEHHGGGYAVWERSREEARRRAHREHEHAVAARDQLRRAEDEARRRAAEGLRRTRGGRGMADGDKHTAEWVRSRAEGVQRRARVIAGRVATLDVPEKPWEPGPLRLELTPAERRSAWVVALEGVVLRLGAWSLGPIDQTVAYGERMLLSGPNGAGNSTLIGALAGRVRPADGIRRVEGGAQIAELGQARRLLVGHAGTAAQAVAALAGLSQTDARTTLATFGLGAEVVQRPSGTLSPGELTRAELAVLAGRRTTCLVLDEPTNHLDVASLEAVEAALAGWPGALVVASHDQRFREALEVTRTVTLPAQ
ncbi:MAG: ATP-binding cassette domain-containing protein [Solirubrobacteraceae bacterium]